MGNEPSKTPRACPPYTAGKHPGSDLLPASDILTLPTLPSSILAQISADGLYYDYYGKFSGAYDAETLLDKPTGRAEKDYEVWYAANQGVAMEVDELVNKNMVKICGKELPERMEQVGGYISRVKRQTVEEKAMEQMSAAQKEMVEEKVKEQQKSHIVQPSKPSYKKDMSSNLKDFMFDASEWKKGKSDKADRDQMVTDVFATLNNSDYSPFYKSAMTMKYVSQYFYKRAQHMSSPATNDEQEEENNGGSQEPQPQDDGLDLETLTKILQKSLSQKFILVNQEKVIQFKDQLGKTIQEYTKAMSGVMFGGIQEGFFSQVQTQLEEQFFKENDVRNLEIYQKVTDKYLAQLAQLQAQGQPMTPQLQEQLIQQSEKEVDDLTLQSYEQLSKQFLSNISATLTDHLKKKLSGQALMNLQWGNANSKLAAPAFVTGPIWILPQNAMGQSNHANMNVMLI